MSFSKCLNVSVCAIKNNDYNNDHENNFITYVSIIVIIIFFIFCFRAVVCCFCEGQLDFGQVNQLQKHTPKHLNTQTPINTLASADLSAHRPPPAGDGSLEWPAETPKVASTVFVLGDAFTQTRDIASGA